MFNRKKPLKAQRGGTQRVQSSAGHWHNGRWFPASAGQAGPGMGRAPARSQRGRNQAGRNRSSYDSGNYSDGESGMARRIGFRF